MGRSVSTPMANTTQSMTRCDNLQARCPARPVSDRTCSITAGEITLLSPASRSTTVSASGLGSKQLPCRVIVIASLKPGSYTHPRLQEAMTCAKTNGIGPRLASHPSSAPAGHLLPRAAIFGAALIFNVLDARGGALITGAVRSELVLCAGRFLLA